MIIAAKAISSRPARRFTVVFHGILGISYGPMTFHMRPAALSVIMSSRCNQTPLPDQVQRLRITPIPTFHGSCAWPIAERMRSVCCLHPNTLLYRHDVHGILNGAARQ